MSLSVTSKPVASSAAISAVKLPLATATSTMLCGSAGAMGVGVTSFFVPLPHPWSNKVLKNIKINNFENFIGLSVLTI
jgi:hypothetical protein